MHIADLLHGAGEQNVSDHGRENNDQNPAPGVQALHYCCTPVETVDTASSASAPFLAFCARSSPRAESEGAHWSCWWEGSAGPPATNPTPPEISAMPSHRSGLTSSCRANLATSANKTYPSDVAGRT